MKKLIIIIAVLFLAVSCKKQAPVQPASLDASQGGSAQNQQLDASKPESEQTKSVDETANWKTYKNDKYGFEIKYPSAWYSYIRLAMDRYANATGQDEFVSFGSVNPIDNLNQDEIDHAQGIYIERQNGSYYADSKVVDDFWNKLAKNDSKGTLVNKFKESKVINGEKFIIFDQYSWELVSQKYIWTPQAVFMHNRNIFWVRPSSNVSQLIFDQVLSTFKFTPVPSGTGQAK